MGFLDLFMSKQRQVQVSIATYMDNWIACMRSFRDAWDVFLSQGHGEEFFYRVDATHKEESRADDLRRRIELDLYSKALIPESRGDILGILESVDRLLSEAEWVLFEVQLQELVIPDKLKPQLSRLVDMACSCSEMVNKAVRILLVTGGKPGVVRAIVDELDAVESEADHLERSIIRTIFKMDTRTGDKILFKELVRQLGNVIDNAEAVGDRLTLVSVKRRV